MRGIGIKNIYYTDNYDTVRVDYTVVYSDFLEEEMHETVDIPSYIHTLQISQYVRMYLEKKWNESKV